ncbi:MAG: arabinofuranosyltransferase [FCB group bacterium]|nr:arabinofuranosyltransferase [FCB group bacterium]
MLAVYLFVFSYKTKLFNDELLVRDMMWLDIWAMVFLIVLLLIWKADMTRPLKGWICISAFSIYCFIAVCMIFDGTPFGYNSYWGDHTFHQAMLLKFMSYARPTDFYYQNLPPFYPPAYFLSMAIYGRLFSIEAYKLMKIGTLAIYLLGPGLLYYSWKKLVPSFQAVFITISCFIIFHGGVPIAFTSPHTFLGYTFFIPWWLYFIEQIKPPDNIRRFYPSGVVIGALLFMTYPYVFFIGGFLLILKTLLYRRWTYFGETKSIHLKRAWIVMGGTAVLSSIYWLPPLISILTYGGKPADQEYFHIGATGLKFGFLDFSLPGLMFLSGLYFCLRRPNARINKGLLILLGGSILFYFLGSILGVLDRPINIVKGMHFILYFSGPLIGLAATGIIYRDKLLNRSKPAITIVIGLIFLWLLTNFNGLAKSDGIKTARTAKVKTWDIKPQEIETIKGSVFLTADNSFPAFYPVFMFISINQHYSHPAARYEQRADFLIQLQKINDPYLFHTALRHNIYDRVDYFMPRLENDRLVMSLNMSNYPNRSLMKKLYFDKDLISNELLFENVGGHIYRLSDEIEAEEIPVWAKSFSSGEDSLRYIQRLKLLQQSLDTTGQRIISEHTGLGE